MSRSLREVVAELDDLYDPRWAADWDAVGTVVGDPDAEVARILFAIDPVQSVVDEAVAWGADLVVTHHPLYLKGVSSVAATTPKGKVVHTLIANGIALHTCHTNADSPAFGVSESMALALGLTDIRPLDPDPADPVDRWVTYVPHGDAVKVIAAMHAAGAGSMGDYDRSGFTSVGTGFFRPLDGANPAVGRIGAVEEVAETRIEMIAPRNLRSGILGALRAAHPYEVPVVDIFEPVVVEENHRGSGRIGTLAHPVSLAEFSQSVAAALPAHHSATRVAGDPSRIIHTVALCGGSGDFLLGKASQAGADVYVSSDLRHHPVSEHLEVAGAPAVIDVPHWAAEWTWLRVAARELGVRLGDTVVISVSQIVTDPWTFLATTQLGTTQQRSER